MKTQSTTSILFFFTFSCTVFFNEYFVTEFYYSSKIGSKIAFSSTHIKIQTYLIAPNSQEIFYFPVVQY